MNALDIPKVKPIDEDLPVHLLVYNTEASTLLLMWISKSKHRLPEKFLSSIRECAWIKTSHGYCRPTAAFLPSKSMLELLEIGDVPFIDKKWVPLKVYIPAFESLGVAVEPGSGYGAVLKCLQELEAADRVEAARGSRLYKYFSICRGDLREDLSTIFVPALSIQGRASWKAKEDCIIHDVDGLFGELNVVALDKYYDKRMLAFFEVHVGVPRKASIDKFCELWLTEKGGEVKADKCYRVLVACRKSSSSTKAWQNFMKSSWIPSIPACGKHSATVKLLTPAKTLIPDELEQENLFKDSTPCLWVAWYPAAQGIDLHELYKMYSAMGVKKLSERVESDMDSCFMNLERKAICGTGFVNQGLLRAVLGYLAGSLSIPCRQNLVLPLFHLREVETDTPLNVHWSLQMDSIVYTAVSQKMVHWNKERQELLYVNEEHRKMPHSDFAAEFARTIALGLLSEHNALVPRLEELLTVLAASTFNIDAVDKWLMRQNIRLYSQDENFLKTGVVCSEVKSTTEELPEDADHLDNITTYHRRAESSPPEVVISTTSATEITRRYMETSAGKLIHRTRTSPPSTYVAPMPPPPDNRRQLLQDAQHVLSSLTSNSNDWMLELANEVFDSERITGWRNAHLPTIRYTLDYPPEQGFVKHGMRSSVNLDKLLTAAFLDASMFPGTKGASHQHLSVVGTACLNLCLAMQLVVADHSRAIQRSLDKLTNDALFAACFRATGLDKCVLVGNSAPVGDGLAAAVMRAVLAVGFCAYDDGLEEVRRIYQHIFLPALDAALN